MLWWCLLLVSWGSTAAESSLEQASLSCKPASNVFDAVKDNARIIDTFFKNQEIIAEGTTAANSPDSARPEKESTESKTRQGMSIKDWSAVLPTGDQQAAAGFFTDETSFLFNTIWKASFATPDNDLLGITDDLRGRKNTTADIQSMLFGPNGTKNRKALQEQFGICKPMIGGSSSAWAEIGMPGTASQPGPCWGNIAQVGGNATLYPMSKSLRIQNNFLTLTLSGKSALGADCLMDMGIQLWLCSTCCCNKLVDYDVAFEDLSSRRNCSLWFMRASSFASQFFESAVLLRHQVQLKERCPADSKTCQQQRIPTNSTAAIALEALYANKTATVVRGESQSSVGNITAANIPTEGGNTNLTHTLSEGLLDLAGDLVI